MIKHFSQEILSNEGNALTYLELLEKELIIDIPRNKNKISLKGKDLWSFVKETWNPEISKNIVRKMFTLSEKYTNGKNALSKLLKLIKEFEDIFKTLQWGFPQGDCDNWLQRLNNNNKDLSGKEKDILAANAIIKNRRLKEINTLRNDYIEYLLFELNTDIIPTLTHHRGVDFFILKNGITEKWDQKVAKSATKQFEKDFGPDWKEYAIEHPEKVAEYLYKYQDEGRFGADNRILVVYLSENVDNENIYNIISNVNLDFPLDVTFSYKHSKDVEKTYNVKCFVILLY